MAMGMAFSMVAGLAGGLGSTDAVAKVAGDEAYKTEVANQVNDKLTNIDAKTGLEEYEFTKAGFKMDIPEDCEDEIEEGYDDVRIELEDDFYFWVMIEENDELPKDSCSLDMKYNKKKIKKVKKSNYYDKGKKFSKNGNNFVKCKSVEGVSYIAYEGCVKLEFKYYFENGSDKEVSKKTFKLIEKMLGTVEITGTPTLLKLCDESSKPIEGYNAADMFSVALLKKNETVDYSKYSWDETDQVKINFGPMNGTDRVHDISNVALLMTPGKYSIGVLDLGWFQESATKTGYTRTLTYSGECDITSVERNKEIPVTLKANKVEYEKMYS